MKKIILFSVLLMLSAFTSSFAQAVKDEANGSKPASALPEDPKLSSEEQALMLPAGEDNPAKIDEKLPVDPKMDPSSLPKDDNASETKAKADEVDLTDPKMNAVESQELKAVAPVPVEQAPVINQPEGDHIGTITDYRTVPSGGIDQPEGDTPQHPDNYKEIQGSNQQPEGDQPNK